MLEYITLPILFFKFWFFEAPVELIAFFASLNKAFLELFSLPLLLKTFFHPWKNEYRKGLVVFSIGIGMFIKSIVIVADALLFILLLFVEIALVIFFLAVPCIALILILQLIQ